MAFRYNRFRGGTRFVNLPRNKRAEAVFKLKHDIANGPYRNFSSNDVLDYGVSWADANFIGRDRFTLWNTTLVTASNHKDDLYRSIAWDQAYGALTKEEYDSRPDPFEDAIKLPNGHSRLVFNTEPTFEKFDGRTFNEQMDHIVSTLNEPIYPGIRIDRSYRYGIGLEVVLDVPLITADIISMFIDEFNTVADPETFTSSTPAIYTDAPVHHSNYLNLENIRGR